MRRSFYRSKRVEMDRLEEEEVGGCGVAVGWLKMSRDGWKEWQNGDQLVV